MVTLVPRRVHPTKLDVSNYKLMLEGSESHIEDFLTENADPTSAYGTRLLDFNLIFARTDRGATDPFLLSPLDGMVTWATDPDESQDGDNAPRVYLWFATAYPRILPWLKLVSKHHPHLTFDLHEEQAGVLVLHSARAGRVHRYDMKADRW